MGRPRVVSVLNWQQYHIEGWNITEGRNSMWSEEVHQGGILETCFVWCPQMVFEIFIQMQFISVNEDNLVRSIESCRSERRNTSQSVVS